MVGAPTTCAGKRRRSSRVHARPDSGGPISRASVLACSTGRSASPKDRSKRPWILWAAPCARVPKSCSRLTNASHRVKAPGKPRTRSSILSQKSLAKRRKRTRSPLGRSKLHLMTGTRPFASHEKRGGLSPPRESRPARQPTSCVQGFAGCGVHYVVARRGSLRNHRPRLRLRNHQRTTATSLALPFQTAPDKSRPASLRSRLHPNPARTAEGNARLCPQPG